MINNEHIQNVTTCIVPVDSVAETCVVWLAHQTAGGKPG